MSGLTQEGAYLIGQRLGGVFKGAMVAHLALFVDWIAPPWSKIGYLMVDHLYRSLQSDKTVVASQSSWRQRVSTFGLWTGLFVAFVTLVPSRRLIMIYQGIMGYGANIFIWSWLALLRDGPRDATNQVQEAFLDSAGGYLAASYFLTHPAVVWALTKWAFVRLGMPLLCIGAVLFYFREGLLLVRIFYQVLISIFVFISQAWDMFDYVEAQVVARFPRFLQHKWSTHQQTHPERLKLPLYQYPPLNVGEIRLLILRKSALYPSVIQAEIVHRPIDECADYEAVSYRWGSSELTEEILVDGCRFPVTKSAFDLLLARRSLWKDRTIWIDTVCINQQDTQEKSEQVQFMCNIYRQASRVVAYPGSDWRYRLAGGLVCQLFALSHQYNTDEGDLSPTKPYEARTPRWRALADLFSDEYFTRAWVVQEVSVGQKTEIYVGGIYIPWTIFAHVINWCLHSSRRRLLTGSDEKDMGIWRSGRSHDSIAVITALRPEVVLTDSVGSFSSLVDLEKLLYVTFSFRATDPRDKVFGLMGIARATGSVALTVPDYSLPVEQVFRNAALAIFSLPRDRRSIDILALAGTGFSDRRIRGPSWVPDFAEERMCNPYSDVQGLDDCYNASGGLLQDLEINAETNSLFVKAIKFDRIQELSELGALDWGLQNLEVTNPFKIVKVLHDFVHAGINLCWKHPSPASATDELDYERLWSFFIAGRIERKTAETKFKEVFRRWLLDLDLLSRARDRHHFDQLFKEGVLGDGPFLASEDVFSYQYNVAAACFGRRIAITTCGRLCIVPPLTQVGDSVIIPLGSQTPFLIRDRSEKPEDIGYELVGEAWVEGVMRGEMIGITDEELIRIS
ncbi:HET-domain-containing protein [Xylaria palmicola]|nr:HET-domain-containing protein [Xylaria palmicola]